MSRNHLGEPVAITGHRRTPPRHLPIGQGGYPESIVQRVPPGAQGARGTQLAITVRGDSKTLVTGEELGARNRQRADARLESDRRYGARGQKSPLIDRMLNLMASRPNWTVTEIDEAMQLKGTTAQRRSKIGSALQSRQRRGEVASFWLATPRGKCRQAWRLVSRET